MKIDGIDIRKYNAKQLTVDIQPPKIAIETEWIDGAPVPLEFETYIKAGTLKLSILFRGDSRNQIVRNVSEFMTLLTHVYDDVGNVLFPPAGADEENTPGGDCVPVIGVATVVWMGKLRIRNAPSFAPETECGQLDTDDTVDVVASVKSDDGKPMWKTADGHFISADTSHTRFTEN